MWTTCAFVVACVAITAPSELRGASRDIALVATVTDRDHRLVASLTPGAFEIRDNGRSRPLTAFDPSRRPLSVTVMLDRSDSLDLGPHGVRAAAARFLTELLPRDDARVCGFTADIVCTPGFTADHDDLAREVRRLRTGFGSRLFDAIASTFDAMQTVPNGARRVVVIFSDGEDNGSRLAFHDVLERARALDVMVYAVGLQTRFDDGDDIVPSHPERTLLPLANETAGAYYEVNKPDDLAAAVTRIEDELRHQYVLTFTPVPDRDHTHRIQVSASNPNLRIRTREHVLVPQR